MNTSNITRQIRQEALKKRIKVTRINVDGSLVTYNFSKEHSEHPALFSVDFELNLEAYDKSHLPLLIEKANYYIDRTEKDFKSKMKKITKKGYMVKDDV